MGAFVNWAIDEMELVSENISSSTPSLNAAQNDHSAINVHRCISMFYTETVVWEENFKPC